MKTKGVLIALLLMTMTMLPAQAVQAADQPLFKMTIVAPGNANLLRRQWGLIIANSFQSVGIDARVLFLGWGSVYDRVLTPLPENIGKTWDNGGFDALLLGWTPGAPSTPYAGAFQTYYSKNTPPNSNYFLWNNATSDQYLEQSLTKGYTPDGIQAFKNWQLIQYQDVPASQIFFQSAVFTADKSINFNGYEWIFDNVATTPQFLTTTRTEVTLASTGELLNLNPPLSNSWYDSIVFSPVFDGLYYLDSSYTFGAAGAVADPTVSADGKTYTYALRHGVKFHDGVEMTADDILFTWLAYLNPQSGSQQSGFTAGYIGDDVSFKWLNGTTTRLVVNFDTGEGFYPATTQTGTRVGSLTAVDAYTVKITIPDFGELGKPAATFHPEGEPGAILPKHVLESVAFADWQNHPFNKGTGDYVVNGVTYHGPIGIGPYKFVSYDATRALVTVEKFNDYWNKTALESAGKFGVQKFYVRYIVEKDAAVAALKNGEVQILDQNYQLARDYTSGVLNFASNYVLKGSGMQQLGYNMEHPIFGDGTATPLGRSNPARAAEAARYVRQALDYLIPRQLICTSLMSGLADPAAVHVNPLSPYLNTACVPRELNVTKARELLAAAGYGTGVPPAGPTPSATYLANQAFPITGNFSIDNAFELAHGGVMVILEKQANATAWTSVALGTTSSGGYYSIPYTATSTGVQTFRVTLTGFGADLAAANGWTTPTFSYWELIGDQLATQISASVVYNVTSVNDLIAPYQAQVANLNNQVSALNGQVSSTTTLMYVGWGVAGIAVVGVLLLMFRKKK